MVEDVKELGAELHRDPIADLEPFERREVEPMDAGSVGSRWSTTQNRATPQRDASGWSTRGRIPVSPKQAGLIEGGRIPKPEQVDLSIAIRFGSQAKLLALAGHLHIITTCSRGRR